MRKRIPLLVLSLFLSFVAFGQTTISEADAPQAGHIYTNETITSNYPPLQLNLKGGNQTWDYSSVTGGSLSATAFSTPTAEDLKDFPTATLVEFDGVQYQYFSVSASNTYLLGMKDTLVKKLNPPLLYNTFPVAYGNTNAGTSKVIISEANPGNIPLLTSNIADSVRVTVTIEKHDTVDAWGTIKTPDSTFSALRVVTHLKTTNKFEAHITPAYALILGSGWQDVTSSAPASYTTPTYTREYNWWANGVGTQVFEILLNGQTGETALGVSWYAPNGLTATNAALSSSTVNFAPNPSNGVVTYTTNGSAADYTISINDLKGINFYNGKIGMGNGYIDLTSLPNGIYVAKISDQSGRFLVKKLEISK